MLGLKTALRKALEKRLGIADGLVMSPPDAQNAIDIFKGQWVSRLPAPFASLRAGEAALFEDARIAWAIEQSGGVSGKRVLELGPLEGGHTYMFHKAGAAEIVALEANTVAYLKCLIVKELFELSRARFMCGNFLPYLETNQKPFDLIVASGVLYHMADPARLMALCARNAGAVFFWTHYFDAQKLASTPTMARFAGEAKLACEGFEYVGHRHLYGNSARVGEFYGGNEPHSHWMERDAILSCARYFGFTKIDVTMEEPGHVHGPCFSFMARK